MVNKEDHAYCDRCYPLPIHPLDPFVAWCGVEATQVALYTRTPENPCQDCLDQPACARCGWAPSPTTEDK